MGKDERYDLAIIGGGPGGYVCAIRASQLGLKTVLIEKRSALGGTCMNVGCIPTKALLESSEKVLEIREEIEEHGIRVRDISVDLRRMMGRKDKVVSELTSGLDFLMKKNRITVVRGTATLASVTPGGVEIEIAGENAQKIESTNCVIATGSATIQLPDVPCDGENIITSDEAIALTDVPRHLVIVGAGVIGLELGSVWRRLGARVTFLELLPHILPGVDRQVRDQARRLLMAQGLEFLFEHRIRKAVVQKAGEIRVTYENSGGEAQELVCDKLLIAVGRRAYLENLGAERVGLKIASDGRVEVDPLTLQTNLPGVFALGDVIRGPMLAHRAEEEGMRIAENLAGIRGRVNYEALPSIVYTRPEIAWAGRTEEELRAEGIAFRTGRFYFRANGRARAMNQTDGFIKLIAEAEGDRLRGVFIVGPRASELIAEAVLALEFGAAAEDLACTFHAHPTLAEGLKEAALALDQRSIHT